jgi:hypothetical protein
MKKLSFFALKAVKTVYRSIIGNKEMIRNLFHSFHSLKISVSEV